MVESGLRLRVPGNGGLGTGERDVPAGRPVQGDPRHSGLFREGAGPAEPDPPALRYENLAPLAADPAGPDVPDDEPLRLPLRPVSRLASGVLRVENAARALS
jgi:hypothetical protein